ncbi:MAG: hypothetical protein HY280_05735 [Nitrospinae bacterium]|nr:hypothetical protein [Nitrospinota bacterium]
MDNSLHGSYSCVEAFIPITLTPLSEGEERLGTRMATDIQLTEVKDLPELDDKVLQTWLRVLDAKLDAVLTLLHKEHGEFSQLPYRRVEISGGGIKIYGQEQFQVDALVEIKTLLPSATPLALYIGAKVLRYADGGLLLNYLPMSEDIRDRIVHYVFSRQRELMRKKRDE